MVKLIQVACLGVVVAMVCPLVVQAQYPSELVGFNGPPINDYSAQEMFRTPQFSGTTSTYIIANVGEYDNNAAFRASGLHTEGAAALQAYFNWVDPADPEAWLRLTTYQGEERPNPSLDTRGKVRFKITNRSEMIRGEIGLCIGIRETGGGGIPQLGDGGTSGPIEWIGVDTTVNAIMAGDDGLVDTAATGDDIQEYPVGYDVIANGLPAETAVISPGANGTIETSPAGDDQDRFGYFLGGPDGDARIPIPAITLPVAPSAYSLEWNLATGVVTVDGSPVAYSGIVGFTGNGILDAPDFRGTFEHIAITNLVDDVATLIDFGIDELQFEATVPDPTPPPAIRGPVVDTDTEVEVECIPDAVIAELFIDGASAGYAPPIDEVATFTGLTLELGNILTATQTANGITSAPSAPVVVYAAGTALAENFDGYISQEDLETLWVQDAPSNDRKIELSTGSASSCQNFVVSDHGPGSTVSRLYYDLGSVDGSDAEPLIVTYRFKHDLNNTEARSRFELASSLTRVHGALGFAFTNGVGGAWSEQYTSMTNSPVPIIDGYVSDYFNYDYALTGVERVPGVWHKMQIEVLTDYVNFYIDDVLANPIDPDTGLPIWPDGVPRVNDIDFKYIIIGVGYSNNGPAMMYDDISATLGDTELPFGDPNPVESPTAPGPLFPAGTLVDVTDIDVTATEVVVYVDDVEAGSMPGPFPEGMATVTVPTLYDGETVTATQVVDAAESCFSWPVVVGVPAPSVELILVMGEVAVDVSDIEENLASSVAVYEYWDGNLFLLGSVLNPTGDPVEVSVPALEAGMVVVATQTIGGVESPISDGVEVAAEPPAIAEWIQTSNLPMGLTDHQLVHLDGYIYCIGGRSNTSPTATDTVYYAVVNYDGSVGEWQTTSTLPAAAATHAAAAHDGRVYVWGGWTTGWPTMNTCWYADQNPDGSLGAWATSAVTIPDNTDVSPPGTQMDAMGRGVMIFDGTLYTINGEWDNGSSFGNTNNCYYSTITPEGDFSPWILTTPTETSNGSWFHGVAAIAGTTENYMYRVAGNYRGTSEWDMYRSTIQPDGSLGVWVEEPLHLPEQRYEIACAVADNKWLFAICGLYGGTPQNTVYYTEIDPDTGAFVEWRAGPEYPETVCRNCAVTYSVGGATYILVGAGGPYSGTVGQRTTSCYYAVLTGALIPGDIDGDGDVDLSDLAALLGSYGKCEGDVGYNPAADLNGDGCVTLSDLAELLGHYGEGT